MVIRRKSYIFRTGRRYKKKRWVSRKTKSNRIFRKFIRRRAQKPELKFSDTSLVNEVSADSSQNTRLTPSTISHGTTEFQRTGNQINIIKVDIRLIQRNVSSITAGFAPIRAAFLTRVIIWSPRVDYSNASTIMFELPFNHNAPYNSVTVYRDYVTYVHPPYMEEGPTDATPAGNGPDLRFRKMVVKFPRKVYFASNSANLDEEKYSLYMTVKTQGAIENTINVRTWWFDA